MKHRIGILLSGCGAADGSDPQEAVLLQLAIERAGHQAVFVALDQPQLHVVDPLTLQEVPNETRNQFRESARLVRGKLHLVSEVAPGMFQALIVCGGQGVAKNLMSSFSASLTDKNDSDPIQPELHAFLSGIHESGGILGFLSLGEFLGSALLGPWPEGKGCFDLVPGEHLVDPEKGRALTSGNLNSSSIIELAKEMDSFVSIVIGLISSENENTL